MKCKLLLLSIELLEYFCSQKEILSKISLAKLVTMSDFLCKSIEGKSIEKAISMNVRCE